jgi:integrase
VDLPAVTQTEDIRYLTQPELRAVLERGVPDDAMGAVEQPRYLMAAMTGLRQGELLGLR